MFKILLNWGWRIMNRNQKSEKPIILKLKEELTDCRVIQLDRKVRKDNKKKNG